MPTHHQITLRFVRKGDGPGSTSPPSDDDVLRVVKLGENSVRVIYTERSTDGTTIDTMQFTYSQLIGYLHRVFWLLSMDDDPFESVNIALPGHPVVLLRVTTLQKNMASLLELFLNTCYTWPAIGRAEVADTQTPSAGRGSAAGPPSPM
jgi:hypothetical protein